MNPKYPIFIISKGRWESRHTSRSLENMGVPYRMVIEESEYDNYLKEIKDKKKLLVLPNGFREDPLYAIPDYEGRCGGSIPVRNWVWDFAKKEGHERYWILDDNIAGFFRVNYNAKIGCRTGTCFRVVEDFSDRYENVSMSGMNYTFFMPRNLWRPPYTLNTRIYSCILLRTDLDFRWRGRYNEDTDLSLRILKSGDCTALFNAFVCGKMATMTIKGGNTEEVYAHGKDDFDNRKEFAESLQNQHPDVVKVIKKWGRYHHHVDYRKFVSRNRLVRKEGYDYKNKIDNYDLVLVRYKDPSKVPGHV